MRPRLSIVIPVRNDAAALRRTLDGLAALPERPAIQVVVAASGDRDGTAGAVGGRAVLRWPDGSTRADLMNAGARLATAPVLLFLHADSYPPPATVPLIERALADPAVVGGAFEHRFEEPGWSLALITAVNRLRYRLTRNYYGDQGIFVRRSAFEALGGYRALAVLEDLDLSQRLKRRGRTVLVPVPLVTSGRRFLARGPWRTLGFIVWLLLLHTLGRDTARYAERWRGPADRTPGQPWPRRPPDPALRSVE